MNETSNGVVIPQETIEDSNTKKKAKRTLRQLPIYRDASNLKYMVARLYDAVPRKYTKFLDAMTNTVGEAKKCVGLAESSRDPEERGHYLRMARVFVEDIQDDATILFRLKIMNTETEKQIKAQVRSIVSQCIAWRDYTNSEGAK